MEQMSGNGAAAFARVPEAAGFGHGIFYGRPAMTSRTRPCEICGKMIDATRADVLPDTRLCIEHAIQITKYGGEFIVKSRMERTSKEGSLKLNYGGVVARKIRNIEGIEKLRGDYLARLEKLPG